MKDSTEVISSWFCGVLVPKIQDGIPYLLVINYHKDPTLRDMGASYNIKLPGGCNKTEEDPLDTLLGEIREEILPPVDGGVSRRNVEYDVAEVISIRDCKDDRHPGTIHRKYFYVVHGLKGPFRDVPRRDDDGTLLSQPYWMPLAALQQDEQLGGLFRGHRKALEPMITHLARQSRKWANVLDSFLK